MPSASEKGIIVYIDTEMNDDLLLEGRARDLIALINKKRKEAGLSPEQKAVVFVDGFEWTLCVHNEWVKKETNSYYILPTKKQSYIPDDPVYANRITLLPKDETSPAS